MSYTRTQLVLKLNSIVPDVQNILKQANVDLNVYVPEMCESRKDLKQAYMFCKGIHDSCHSTMRQKSTKRRVELLSLKRPKLYANIAKEK